MKKLLFALTLVFVSVVAVARPGWAQLGDAGLVVTTGNLGSFFMALVAGVILAIGFQILLTILSVACGVSLVGNVEDRFGHPHAPHEEKSHDSGNVMTKITTGIGMWTMATTSFSLFFASLLAVKMSLIGNNQLGVALGLVIWAAFFIAMTYFEMRSAKSILGAVFATVFSGIRSSANFVQDILSRSQVHKTAEAIRAEIVDTLQDPHLKHAVHDYVKKFQAPAFDFSKAKKELIKVLGDFEIRSIMKEGGLERETFISLAQKHPHLGKEDVEKLGNIYDDVKEAMKVQGDTGADKVINAIGKLSGGSEDDSQKIREKFENYLRSAEVDALNPESLKEDLNKIVSDPKSTKQVVLNRIKQFDHPTIVSIVSKKTKLSQEQANQVINRVETVLESIKERASKTTDKIEGAVQGAQEQKEEVASGQAKSAIEDKVRSYFNSLQRPELDYEQIKNDFEQIFHDPKASVDILKTRFKTLDRGSLIAIVGSWPNVSYETAEKIVNKIEEARSNIIRKAEEIEEKVKVKSQEAKEAALHQAENVRQSVMVSAWWLFATAALSACFSALGGMLALG